MAERATTVKHAGKPAGGRHAASDRASDPKAIVAAIAHTRSELSKTIAAIADRLSPERLASEAVSAATELVEQVSQTVDDLATSAVKEADAVVRSAAKDADALARSAVDDADDLARAAIAEAEDTGRKLAE